MFPERVIWQPTYSQRSTTTVWSTSRLVAVTLFFFFLYKDFCVVKELFVTCNYNGTVAARPREGFATWILIPNVIVTPLEKVVTKDVRTIWGGIPHNKGRVREGRFRERFLLATVLETFGFYGCFYFWLIFACSDLVRVRKGDA